MRAPAKLAAFGLVLAAALGAGFAAGDMVGPLGTDQSADVHGPGEHETGTAADGALTLGTDLGVPGEYRPAGFPAVRRTASVPSAGVYRLFLDFSHGGVVRTAAFTVEVSR